MYDSGGCSMLSGRFDNCYGLRHFELPTINFPEDKSAIIYAPNGVMKSSFSNVLSDISKGNRTFDRIFSDNESSYDVTFGDNHYEFNSANDEASLSPTDRIYVIHTFSDTFEFTKDTVGTLLADEDTRSAYHDVMAQFNGRIRQLEENLRNLTGLTKPQIKVKLIDDLGLAATSDWTDIIEKIHELMPSHEHLGFLDDCKYNQLFNEKTMAVYGQRDFATYIFAYITNLNSLLTNNPVLNTRFTDRNAENLGKELKKNNIFAAQHTIHLKGDTTVIHSLEEWNATVKEQLHRLYQTPELTTPFQNLKKLLTANAEVLELRRIIVDHREIIPQLNDIASLKIQVWLECFSKLTIPFSDYYTEISQYTGRIRELYQRAAEQSESWENAVDEFNRRFRVPFKVRIDNKANFLLKEEAPTVTFEYHQGIDTPQTAVLKKEKLMGCLSTGEQHALYLLYILFDLQKIRQRAQTGDGPFLIVADDVADSFDYKNKYAIIEYLSDLNNTAGIDLLVLTHNFDFYRTLTMRWIIPRENHLIAQRDTEGSVSISVFKYQRDFFKKVIVEKICNGKISSDSKKKLLFASIPFYRNLCEYSQKDDDYLKLTCFMHLKTTPLNTATVGISTLWGIVKPYLNDTEFGGADEGYYATLIRIAEQCVHNTSNEVILEDKLIISLAIRLLAESFLKRVIEAHGQQCGDASKDQTREWFNLARPYLTPEAEAIIDEVNLITPENIHVNSFMFEPLIDVSDWALKNLYNEVSHLQL